MYIIKQLIIHSQLLANTLIKESNTGREWAFLTLLFNKLVTIGIILASLALTANLMSTQKTERGKMIKREIISTHNTTKGMWTNLQIHVKINHHQI